MDVAAVCAVVAGWPDGAPTSKTPYKEPHKYPLYTA
jgi:hypothetical protein